MTSDDSKRALLPGDWGYLESLFVTWDDAAKREAIFDAKPRGRAEGVAAVEAELGCLLSKESRSAG